MADLDRKVRAIYDALDARNWKKAIQQADAILGKWKGAPEPVHIVRVLKGFALDRSGRTEEAIEACEAVRTTKPPVTDDHVLSTMMIVYKSAGKVELMVPSFEAAAAADPTPEMYRQLFAIYLRTGDLVKQQQAAMKLSRLMPGGAPGSQASYVWWIIMSVVLQSRAALSQPSPSLNTAQLLKLAGSMISRHVEKEGGKLKSYEELLILLDVLHAQGEHQAALEAVRGEPGSVVSLAADRKLLEARCLERLGDTQEAAAIYKGLLEANPDDWAVLHLFLDCCFPSTRAGASGEASHRLVGVQGGIEAAVGFGGQQQEEQEAAGAPNEELAAAVIRGLKETQQEAEGAGSHLVRGAHLGAVELAVRRLRLVDGDPKAAMEALAEAILSYFRAACTKVSCAADLRPHVKALMGIPCKEAHEAVASGLRQAAEGPSPSSSSAAASGGAKAEAYALRERVAAYQLLHDMGRLGSPGDAADLMALFSSTLHLSAETDERERGLGDELISLAVSALMGSRPQEGHPADHILAALIVAKAGCCERPHSPGVRLPAAALYGLLGCPKAADKEFTALDVKGIQHSSLTGHFLVPFLALGSEQPGEKRLTPLLSEVLKVHDDHLVNAADTLLTAYTHSSYSKVAEFAAFAERLKSCHSRYLAVAELAAMSLRKAAWASHTDVLVAALEARDAMAARGISPLGPGEFLAAGSMRFNEDLSTRPNWLQPRTGPCHLGVLEWWGGHRSSPSATATGYGCCWWSRLYCAESDAEEAKHMREQLADALRQRCLLPSLLVSAMHACSPPAAEGNSTGVADLKAAVAALRDSSPSREGAAQAIDGCSLALWTFSESLAELWLDGAGDGGSGSDPSVAAERLGAQAAALEVQLDRASAEGSGRLRSLAQPPAVVLPGDSVAFAAALLLEPLSWTTVCLEAWFAALKEQKKGKANKAQGSGSQAHQRRQDARRVLSQVAQAVTKAAGTLLGAFQEHLDSHAPGSSSATELLSSLEDRHGGGALWGWSAKSSAEAVVHGVLAEQHKQMEALAAAASDRLKRLKALPLAAPQ